MFMVDYGTFSAADGWLKAEDLTLCCLLNGDLTDSFAVSGHLDNQLFTVRSAKQDSAVLSCDESSSKVAEDTVFSIQSQSKAGKSVSVKCVQSTFYIISKQISNQINITINALKREVAAAVRRVKRIITNMKGSYRRRSFCTLCLLRL